MLWRTHVCIAQLPNMNISLLVKFWSKNSAKIFSLPKKKKRKWIQDGSQSFYNLVLEVTLPHFCQILCIRSESASLTHTQGKGITQRHRHQENHLRICLPQCISSVLTSPFYRLSLQFSSVQSFSCVRLFATPWIAACQASLSITNSRSSLRLMSIESVMPSSHLILCHPLHLLPPIPPSIRVFSNESTLRMRWTKYWSFSFSIITSKEIPGLISFRMDWDYLLEVVISAKHVLGTLGREIKQEKYINHVLALGFFPCWIFSLTHLQEKILFT